MNPFWITLVLILVLIYIISPIDGMPDIIPFLGWLDDTFLAGLLVYYLRYRRLPGFVNRLLAGIRRWFFPDSPQQPEYQSGTSSAEKGYGNNRQADSAAVKDPYEILGVRPGVSPEELLAAYRAAAQQYHPDKVAHLGEELQALAQKKFVEIQEAYHILSGKQS